MIADIYIPGIGCLYGQITSNIPATASQTTTILFMFKAANEWYWAFQPIKPVTTLNIAINGRIAHWITTMQGQKSEMLRWHSFWCSGRKRVAVFLAYKCGEYFQYASKWPSLWLITWITRPEIVDSLVTLNFRIGQGAYWVLFWL
jgi:hypothetical protein